MYHAGLGEGTLCACGPALAAVTVGTSWIPRQVDLGVCAKATDEEGQRRRASRGVFQPRGEKNRQKLKQSQFIKYRKERGAGRAHGEERNEARSPGRGH